MREYSYINKWETLLTPDIVSMISAIQELKGEQNLYVKTEEDTLNQLVEVAKIQSTEASNKIEGIFTSNDRLKKLLSNKTTPKSRDEQEIAGYRDVLSSIHENYDYIPIKPSIMLQLHRDLYKFSGKSIGGNYKNSDNIIAQEDEFGNKFIRFAPVPAWETPEAMEKLCLAYDEVLNKTDANALLVIPMFILDFLCIHPFNDGNGRMSRLLTLLLLYRSGYMVGKYISVEKLIENTKETYYDALHSSSQGWHECENDYSHFVKYMLGIVLSAYRDFSERAKVLTADKLSKPEKIREVIKASLGKITKTEIMKKCPDISQVTVQRTLNDLIKSGDIIKIGGGRYTSYVWNGDKN